MRLFGTDGIRGVAGKYPLDPATIGRIGAAAAQVLKAHSQRHIIIIGRDTRESGSGITAALAQAFSGEGVEVWDIGVIPTPGIAHLVKHFPVLAGVVVSASHNPFLDNGIKFFGPQGTKLSDALEQEIEKNIHATENSAQRAAVKSGDVKQQSDLLGHYTQFLRSSFAQGVRQLQGMRLVIDCAHGATYRVAPELFAALGAEVTALNVAPDGRNINKGAGSLHPETLAKEVMRTKSFCGLAFDGDGDRVIFVDEHGHVRDGDYILAIASWYLKNKGELVNNTLVTTVMANLGLFKAMEKLDINVLKTPVGDRYVYEEMMRSGAVIGGEQSGHIIFRNFLPTGDGMLSAVQMLAILGATGKPLTDLCTMMTKYPQILVNTKVARRVPIESLPKTVEAIKAAEMKLKSDGRVLVRYSGTESLLRVMVEGPEKDAIAVMADEIVATATREIEMLPV